MFWAVALQLLETGDEPLDFSSHQSKHCCLIKEIILYVADNGKSPIKDFLDSLEIKVVQKIAWVFQLLRDQQFIPQEYFKKLKNTDGIWEIRIKKVPMHTGFSAFLIKAKLSTLEKFAEALDKKLEIRII
ncbi:MAG: hypothetical protein HQ557_09595 [Bacteroidetes bacterium]|nr:hypothetical protein [Bacteroidota bacterium]